MFTSAAKTCSYQGQDLFVLEVLNGMRNGFFLDSGASDGLKGSNSRLFETDYGWTGICIEPNESLFGTLCRSRRCLCLNCCLASKEGPVDFLEAAGVFGGIVQEYDPGHLEYAYSTLSTTQARPSPWPTVTKYARTLRNVLRECGAPRVIDYWSLDTEGSELSLLRSFPFDEFTFRVLTVEHNQTPARAEIRGFLESRGYVWVRSLGIDDGYVLAELSDGQARHSAVWRRKLFH